MLSLSERETLVAAQHQAQRWSYLGSGMSHPNFLATVGQLSVPERERLEGIAPMFS